jgi:hypothetical protein
MQGILSFYCWTSSVLTCFAALLEPTEEKMTLDAFYLMHSAEEAANNILTGWSCSTEVNWLAVLLAVTVALLTIASAATIRAKKNAVDDKDQATAKATAFNAITAHLMVAFTLVTPFAISHVAIVKFVVAEIATYTILVEIALLIPLLGIQSYWNQKQQYLLDKNKGTARKTKLAKADVVLWVMQVVTAILIAILGSAGGNFSHNTTAGWCIAFFVIASIIPFSRILLNAFIAKNTKIMSAISLAIHTASVVFGSIFISFLLKNEHQTTGTLYPIWLLWILLPIGNCLIFCLLLVVGQLAQKCRANPEEKQRLI